MILTVNSTITMVVNIDISLVMVSSPLYSVNINNRKVATKNTQIPPISPSLGMATGGMMAGAAGFTGTGLAGTGFLCHGHLNFGHLGGRILGAGTLLIILLLSSSRRTNGV